MHSSNTKSLWSPAQGCLQGQYFVCAEQEERPPSVCDVCTVVRIRVLDFLQRQLRKVESKQDSFYHGCIRTVLGIMNSQQWEEHITLQETRQRWGDVETATDKVHKHRLEWLGHLARMPTLHSNYDMRGHYLSPAHRKGHGEDGGIPYAKTSWPSNVKGKWYHEASTS